MAAANQTSTAHYKCIHWVRTKLRKTAGKLRIRTLPTDQLVQTQSFPDGPGAAGSHPFEMTDRSRSRLPRAHRFMEMGMVHRFPSVFSTNLLWRHQQFSMAEHFYSAILCIILPWPRPLHCPEAAVQPTFLALSYKQGYP